MMAASPLLCDTKEYGSARTPVVTINIFFGKHTALHTYKKDNGHSITEYYFYVQEPGT